MESPTALASNEIAGVHDTAVLLTTPMMPAHAICPSIPVRLYGVWPKPHCPRSYGCRLKMKTARQDFSIPPIAGGSVWVGWPVRVNFLATHSKHPDENLLVLIQKSAVPKESMVLYLMFGLSNIEDYIHVGKDTLLEYSSTWILTVTSIVMLWPE